jgi:Reverse transcriptase (RNA-dependent DNA polymerase)
MRAVLNGAKLTPYFRGKFWAQCANHITKLENIISKQNDAKSAHIMFYGKNPNWIENLHIFGEIGIINNGNKIQGKLNNKGFPAMFIGYPEDHTSNVFQFINLETQSLILSRNVTWIEKMYGDYRNKTEEETSGFLIIDELEEDKENQDDDTNNENEPVENEGNQNENDSDDSDDDDEDGNAPKTRISGLQRALNNLNTFYNPTTEQANICRALIANIHDGNPEPKNYHEVKNSKDWKHWWQAMSTEFKNMEDKKVWTIISKSDLPSGRKLIGNRWVYAVKDDGRFRARTVAQGFSQVPGKDFYENHAPVVNDATFHLVMALKVLLKLESGQFDIETAFLYGDLDEEIWMAIPDGYPEYVKEKDGTILSKETHCLKLNKALYGLVQAARQWWKKFKEVMVNLGYKPSPVDPCLFVKNTNGKLSFIIIYVDDGGIFSTQDDIDKVIKELGKTFKVKNLGKLENFVGCRIIQSKDKTKLWIHQPKLIKHLEEDFSKYITTTREFITPAGPKTHIVRPNEDELKITSAEQTIFRSGVGMLLYLIKHSRPDIANGVRELSKVADGATYGHWKALIRMIKYVLDTKNQTLKMEPKVKEDKIFFLKGISDSEYSGDKDTRISVYGYIVYFCGAPISWKSKSGKSVTLSSTEAEYFAISELAKELIYLKQLIEHLGIKLEYPIIVRVDNVGAIFIGNNFTTSQRTKHIDIRAHFVREFIEDGIIKIVFIKSEDNDADIFTKNAAEETFMRHTQKFLSELPYEEQSK